jgi:hypothetical protein
MLRYINTNGTAQSSATSTEPSLSIGTLSIPIEDDDNASETPVTSTPSVPSLHLNPSVRFTVNWNVLRFHGLLLRGVGYRIRHKRTIGTDVKVSWIWKHGADLDWKGKRLWLCKLCHLAKRYENQLLVANGTTHIHEHMASFHGLREHGEVIHKVAQAHPFEAATVSYNIATPFNEEQYKRDYIDWAICEDVTFRQATSERTRNLLSFDRPRIDAILPKSAGTLSDWIKRSYEQRHVDVKNMLLISKSKVNISCDLWTSSNGLTLCGVVAHFISKSFLASLGRSNASTDNEGRHKTALLGLPRLRGSHSGENIAGCLASVIKKYEIEHKLGCFMMDNAKDNDTCMKELAKSLPIDTQRQRLRCAGHIIHLVVKALLFGKGVNKFQRELLGCNDKVAFDLWRKKGCIGKVHNTVTYINRSDQRRQDFCALQAELSQEDEIFEYQLLKDGGIRWNSTFFMLRRAAKLRNAIDLYHTRWEKPANDPNAYDLSQDALKNEDWIEIERYIELLRPFVKMTKQLEGNANKEGYEGAYGAVWEVIESMDCK